jgi:hypothetical protein
VRGLHLARSVLKCARYAYKRHCYFHKGYSYKTRQAPPNAHAAPHASRLAFRCFLAGRCCGEPVNFPFGTPRRLELGARPLDVPFKSVAVSLASKKRRGELVPVENATLRDLVCRGSVVVTPVLGPASSQSAFSGSSSDSTSPLPAAGICDQYELQRSTSSNFTHSNLTRPSSGFRA